MRFGAHSWSDAVAVVANAQVVSAMPNGISVEIDQMNNPFVNNLLTEPLSVTNGQLRLSGAPGLGIELDMDAVERFRLQDPLYIPDGVYSDMMFVKENFPPTLPYLEMADD